MADGRWVVDVLSHYAREWDDTIKLADRVPRIQLATPVGQLQRIRREVQAQTWPACGQQSQRLLVEAMDAHIQGFLSFMGNQPGYEAEISRAEVLLEQLHRELGHTLLGLKP